MLLAVPALTWAQTPATPPPSQVAPPETREEALRRERAAKQSALEPSRPNGIEWTMNLLEKRVQPLLARDGVYARLGSLTTGSGFAYGVGFRNRRLFNRHGRGDVWVAGSLKHYWTIEGRVNVTPRPSGVVSIDTFIRRMNYPQEEFFGLGPDSRRPDRSDYRMRGTIAGAMVTVKPARYVSFGGGADYLGVRLDPGTAANLPNVEGLFDDLGVPGLATQPNYVQTSAFAQVDYRQPLNARKGGWYRAAFSRYADQNNGAFSFRRLDLEVRQFASVLAERRVFAGRALVSMTEPDAGSRTPFYLMPYLGGNDTLRGFRAYRFRGPNAMLLQAEYRFEIWAGLDGALFYDTGKVTLRRADLNFKDLERDYGFGFRFNTDEGVIMRVDAAFGSRDGRHLHIVFGTLF
jgi:hypothetical protein